MKEKQNMTSAETEHDSLKALELYSVPGQGKAPFSLLALSMPESSVETANTAA